MKKIIILLCLSLVSCGRDVVNIVEPTHVETSSDVNQSLEGYYVLPNGGFIELVQLSNGTYVIYGTQRVLSVNKDSGLALHPNLPTTPAFLVGGALNGVYNANYSNVTNDVENDVTEVDITGSRLTNYTLYRTSNGTLKIILNVYSSNGLSIEASRTIESL